MTDFYVDSNAVGLNDGTSWTDAWTSITSAPGGIAAGDRVFVDDGHSESVGAAITLNWPGTEASPNRIICADKASGAPPTTISTGAAVSTTGGNDLTISGTGWTYSYGIDFTAGDSASVADLIVSTGNDTVVTLDQCNLILGSTSTAADIWTHFGLRGVVILKGCGFRFAQALQSVSDGFSLKGCIISGGSILSGGTSPNNFTNGTINFGGMTIEGFDFSNASSTINVYGSNTAENFSAIIRNCKMPASWTGSFINGTPAVGSNFEAYNCDDGDTNYVLQIDRRQGTISQETTLVKDSGASDGTTQISWKMASNADAEWNHQTLESPPIIRWNEQIDTTITVTVDILHDSVTALQDDEIWIEIQYLGTTGFPLSLFADDAAADYLATPANQATSSATWTTTGMSNPNEQQLSVDITPREVGYIQAKVHLAKPSYTVYVDPLLLVT